MVYLSIIFYRRPSFPYRLSPGISFFSTHGYYYIRTYGNTYHDLRGWFSFSRLWITVYLSIIIYRRLSFPYRLSPVISFFSTHGYYHIRTYGNTYHDLRGWFSFSRFWIMVYLSIIIYRRASFPYRLSSGIFFYVYMDTTIFVRTETRTTIYAGGHSHGVSFFRKKRYAQSINSRFLCIVYYFDVDLFGLSRTYFIIILVH
jgi:hypothetical protein